MNVLKEIASPCQRQYNDSSTLTRESLNVDFEITVVDINVPSTVQEFKSSYEILSSTPELYRKINRRNVWEYVNMYMNAQQYYFYMRETQNTSNSMISPGLPTRESPRQSRLRSTFQPAQSIKSVKHLPLVLFAPIKYSTTEIIFNDKAYDVFENYNWLYQCVSFESTLIQVMRIVFVLLYQNMFDEIFYMLYFSDIDELFDDNPLIQKLSQIDEIRQDQRENHFLFKRGSFMPTSALPAYLFENYFDALFYTNQEEQKFLANHIKPQTLQKSMTTGVSTRSPSIVPDKNVQSPTLLSPTTNVKLGTPRSRDISYSMTKSRSATPRSSPSSSLSRTRSQRSQN